MLPLRLFIDHVRGTAKPGGPSDEADVPAMPA